MEVVRENNLQGSWCAVSLKVDSGSESVSQSCDSASALFSEAICRACWS